MNMSLDFSNLVSDIAYEEEKRQFELIETKYDYKITCTQVNKEKLIIIKSDKIKEYSKFIKCNPPKDCDYILVNEERRTIFFLELKHGSQSSSAKEVREQLRSGKKWFEHLTFILGYENIFDEYDVFLIHSVYDARQDRRLNLIPFNSVFKINGPRINLLEFYNITHSEYKIKLANFDLRCPKDN